MGEKETEDQPTPGTGGQAGGRGLGIPLDQRWRVRTLEFFAVSIDAVHSRAPLCALPATGDR